MANKASYIINRNGGISLALYDEEGRIKKEFHNHDHGQPKYHNFGIFGEHYHEWDYDAYEKALREGTSNKKGKKPQPHSEPKECETEEDKKIMRKLL